MKQKVIALAPYDGQYHNFMTYSYPNTMKGMISDGWILKETFHHGKERVTLVFERG